MKQEPKWKELKADFKAVDCYRNACNELAHRVSRRLFGEDRDFYWVGEDVGGVCDFGDADFLNAEDMARILDTGMGYREYAEWREANLENDKKINLRSWLKGCRHSMLTT